MSKLRLIISVWGRSKIGKTSTLKELAKILENKGEILYLKGDYYKAKGDFTAIFRIKNVKIAIVSKGDPPANKRKEELLSVIRVHEPSVLFCASRTSGDTVKALRSISKNHNSKLIWTSPYESDKKQGGYDDLNRIKAEHLSELVEQI